MDPIYLVEWLNDVDSGSSGAWQPRWAVPTQLDGIISVVNQLRKLGYDGDIVSSGWGQTEMFVRSDDWQYQYRITPLPVRREELGK